MITYVVYSTGISVEVDILNDKLTVEIENVVCPDVEEFNDELM